MIELLTDSGEVLKFDTLAEMIDYTLSRMVERGDIEPVDRNANGDLRLRALSQGFAKLHKGGG
jgi:hypothetical protein